MARSELERRAIDLLDAHGLPRPAVNAHRGPYEVDLSWPDRALVVELDGRATHATAAAFDRDRRRDVELQARGWRVLRFGWSHVVYEPRWVARHLADALA
jgi:very-short-patch-repair endonuclease